MENKTKKEKLNNSPIYHNSVQSLDLSKLSDSKEVEENKSNTKLEDQIEAEQEKFINEMAFALSAIARNLTNNL